MAFLWEGRLKKGILHPMVESYTFSIVVDRKLAEYDVRGSIAHVEMLSRAKIISIKDARKLVAGLKKILREIKMGTFVFKPEDEDIHTAVERRLQELAGETGKKLHTARSRNDQVVLDEKLYLLDVIPSLMDDMVGLQKAIVRKADEVFPAVAPMFTHLQTGQPVLMSHHLLAYVCMLERDRGRMRSALDRIAVSPLGACAGVGTSFPIDPLFTARRLGFASAFSNSVDAVSDRDFIIETLAVCAITMMHLSRIAEDLILWTCPLFAFVSLPDDFCTGSSIMPQKKNPDVLELVRGKTAVTIGNIAGILALMKGLPLSYNRDLQEDKRFLFETVEILSGSLKILSQMFPGIRFDIARMAEAAKSGFSVATDIAEELVRRGIPFRDAHRLVGELAGYAAEHGILLKDIPLEVLQTKFPKIDLSFLKNLDGNKSVRLKKSPGGTGLAQVAKEIKRWKNLLS